MPGSAGASPDHFPERDVAQSGDVDVPLDVDLGFRPLDLPDFKIVGRRAQQLAAGVDLPDPLQRFNEASAHGACRL